MHKNCPNEQFLEFLLGDIAAEAAWELSPSAWELKGQ